jgi:hypothetical protein
MASPSAVGCTKPPGGGTTATPPKVRMGSRRSASGVGASWPSDQERRARSFAVAKAASNSRSSRPSGWRESMSRSMPVSQSVAVTRACSLISSSGSSSSCSGAMRACSSGTTSRQASMSASWCDSRS